MEKPKLEDWQRGIRIPIRITKVNDKVILCLRREVMDKRIMKLILYSACTGDPLICYPYFSNHVLSIPVLIEKKLVNYDWDTGKYSWGEKLK